LLRYKANKIADYEALHHIHWQNRPDPKYIYYIGHSKNFEEWYNNVKKDGQSVIYEELEKKSTKYIIKKDYDHVSIWKYNIGIEAINKQIQEAEKMKKDFDNRIKELHEKLNSIHDSEKTKKELREKLKNLKNLKTD
jgi:DNA polymerase II small subunit/DNA polymerase delta subunit B